MYLPRLFQEQDSERLFAFMRRYSFATLVTVTPRCWAAPRTAPSSATTWRATSWPSTRSAP
ncbi:MAG: FMN-binding negative transcriptional regulator [Hyalangium sp.]|uniref:FMN-binding negative transcriptional regulator n=1 Tax=Hyalangium sp. TaxID=2028555 RepID=UPI003899C4F2